MTGPVESRLSGEEVDLCVEYNLHKARQRYMIPRDISNPSELLFSERNPL
jgi:hypothetical protein